VQLLPAVSIRAVAAAKMPRSVVLAVAAPHD